jgi:hypothetical protein
MGDTDPASRQPQPGYRGEVIGPFEAVICQRRGAPVKTDDTDLHDRFHVSVEHPATMPSTGTGGGWKSAR